MIGRLQGILIEKQPPQLLIDVGGVCYEVDASMNTFYHLPETGNPILLHTHFVVREDAQLLYGFFELAERTLFRSLIRVNGVGPKLALTILSSITPDELRHRLLENDAASLVKLPGVGKKTAERLIIEMRDKLPEHNTSGSLDLFTDKHSNKQQAISALVALGYKANEAEKLLKDIDFANQSVEETIRQALRKLN